MADKSFAIHAHHRPRRVAFLVDFGKGLVEEILLSILRFNLDAWGGRHNPIVPLVDAAVPESYYALLDVADPDVFYVYGELGTPAIEAIHARYSPTLIAQHFVTEPIDSRSYCVGLREQASIRKYLRNLREKLPPYFRQQEPCVLQLGIAEGLKLSPFFLWNFGYTDSNYFAIQNSGVSGCSPISTNDHDLLELLANHMNLVWPVNVCGDAPLSRTTGDSWRYHFPIFFGASQHNAVAYWNDGLAAGPTSSMHGGMNQIWLTPRELENEAAYRQLVRLFQLRVHSGNSQKGIRMISCDTDQTELERIGKKIAEDVRGILYYKDCVKFDPLQGEAVEPRKVTTLFSPRGEIDYATGNEIHLALGPPSDIGETAEECWMADLRIYNPEQELWYANATPWWRLPRNSSISGLFNRYRPQRIIFDRRISFEVGGKETTLDFEIPSSGKLFRHLLSPHINYHLAGDLRSKLKGSSSYEIRLSDKGLYLSGILGLSGPLRETLYLFEQPFWRSLLERLSKREPSKQLMEKLTSDARDLLRNAWSRDPAAIASELAEEVILVSKQLPKASGSLTFSKIEKLHADYINGLVDEEKKLSGRNLKADLSSLTRDNVLFQGAELRCPNCISSFWYSIEEIGKIVTCRGCQISFPLPAEIPWSYQLNELIRAGIGDHGLLPVMRTLARLFDHAQDCFFFTPSVEFLAYPDEGEPTAERELDLAWVKDGLFGIAEVKTTTKLFKLSDYENMAELARVVRPDILLIAALDGTDDDLLKGKRAVEERLGSSCEVWAWGPDAFKSSPFWARD